MVLRQYKGPRARVLSQGTRQRRVRQAVQFSLQRSPAAVQGHTTVLLQQGKPGAQGVRLGPVPWQAVQRVGGPLRLRAWAWPLALQRPPLYCPAAPLTPQGLLWGCPHKCQPQQQHQEEQQVMCHHAWLGLLAVV